MLQQQQQAPRRAARCAAVSQLPVSPTHGSTPTHLSSTATADSRPSSAARISGVTPDGSDAFVGVRRVHVRAVPAQRGHVPPMAREPPQRRRRRPRAALPAAAREPPEETPSAAVEAERSRRVSPCWHTWPGASG